MSNGARGDLAPLGGDKRGDNAKNLRRRENREIPRDLRGAGCQPAEHERRGARRPVRSKIQARQLASVAAIGATRETVRPKIVATEKIFAAEKIARYRAICMALDASPRNTGAAVPVVKSDPKSKRGNSHQWRQ